MISVSKDTQGRVIAYMESRNVGQSGFDKLNGEYIFIADLWIHDSHKNDWSVYRELMQDVFRKMWSAKQVYFVRKKYKDRVSNLYSKERIMKLLDRSPMMLIKELV